MPFELDTDWDELGVLEPETPAQPYHHGPYHEARALGVRLRSNDAPRVRTGVVLCAAEFWREPHTVAARLDAAPISLVERLLARVPSDARAVPLGYETLYELVAQVADERRGGDVAWLFDLDLLLAKLPATERARWWDAMFERLAHRARGLLLALPLLENAPINAALRGDEEDALFVHRLGPSREQAAHWHAAGRYAVLRGHA